MIFRQLIDPETSTFTYLIADERTHEAVLIDSVREHYERDATILDELGLKLPYTLETHVHADHVTASGLFRRDRGSQSVGAAKGGASCVDIPVMDGDSVEIGSQRIEVRATPGHTDGCLTGRSGKAARILENLGFTRVVSLAGGMRAWNERTEQKTA